jgi:hypothetical protein
VAVIATEWPEFNDLDWASIRTVMREPLVFDGRRLLDGAGLRELGYRYEAVGSATGAGNEEAGTRGVAAFDSAAG